MSSDSPINYNKRPNMEQYTKQYGNIRGYKLDEIYTNIVKKNKWSTMKSIELFEELMDEQYDELSFADDEFDRSYITSKIRLIKCYIEFLEGSLR